MRLPIFPCWFGDMCPGIVKHAIVSLAVAYLVVFSSTQLLALEKSTLHRDRFLHVHGVPPGTPACTQTSGHPHPHIYTPELRGPGASISARPAR